MLLVHVPTELFRITAILLVARLDRPFTLSFDDPKGGSGSILVKMEESLPLTSSTVCVRFGLITRAPSQTCAVELLERPFCHPHFRCTITTSAEPLYHLALSPDLRSRPHGDSFASDSAATSSSSSFPHNAVVSFTDRLVLCHGNRLCAECVYLLAASTSHRAVGRPEVGWLLFLWARRPTSSLRP